MITDRLASQPDYRRRQTPIAAKRRLARVVRTVVEIVEDIDEYRGFEAAIIADSDARTAVERKLVLRFESLLWRLRRATAIETELLRIQAEVSRDRRSGPLEVRSQKMPSAILGDAVPAVQDWQEDQTDSDPWMASHSPAPLAPAIARGFLRLATPPTAHSTCTPRAALAYRARAHRLIILLATR